MVSGVEPNFDAMDEDLLGEATIFYNEFPPLPEFPCMSSSSSSSTPAPAKPMMSSSTSSSASSSGASPSILKSDADEDQHLAAAGPSAGPASANTQPMAVTAADIDCMDVMENLGYMDLIDTNNLWDPASIFQNENGTEFQHQQHQRQHQDVHPPLDGQFGDEPRPMDELGAMFFEWLKSNKEYISAEDMRNIKLKRSTVESASKRLGSTTEGKKQLLKLILDWVEQYQLQKKKIGETEFGNSFQLQFQYQEPPIQNPNPNLNISCVSAPAPPNDLNACLSPAPWAPSPPPPYAADPSRFLVAAPPMSATPYEADPYLMMNGPPGYPLPADYQNQTLDSPQTWPPTSHYMPMVPPYCGYPGNNNNNNNGNNNFPSGQGYAGYGDQVRHQCYNGFGAEKLVRFGSSATKEARKKRMARQKRFLLHHRHHHNNSQSHNVNQNQNVDQQARRENETCAKVCQGNWVYLPNNGTGPSSSAMAPVVLSDEPQSQNQSYQRRPVSADGSQGWKPEKNLKFLLQKVLKQSDVGNLGRIVLPKKEAETHLPELDSRDGIPIAMEDIGTSRLWNMRYRFWPNNKSRMYLLENTGDFVKANGLQEGDFIVLYTDVKSNKYLIRGVKVRQGGQKAETSSKKPAKNHRNCTNGSCSPQASQRIECD